MATTSVPPPAGPSLYNIPRARLQRVAALARERAQAAVRRRHLGAMRLWTRIAGRCDLVEMDVDLSTRVAKCGSCGKQEPSSDALAFFEYRGPGTSDRKCRTCGYYVEPHEKSEAERKRTDWPVCDNFEPRTEGFPTDLFYCGCRGWD